MKRPGFLGNSNYRNGLGFFGKGAIAPPPGPPPGPGKFTGTEWVCPGDKPASTATEYYHCCPSGWTKVPFGDTNPCKGKDREIMVCGPLPEGANPAEATCCENLKEWVPLLPGDPDPCKAAALASGRAVPGVPGTILADDIVIPNEPLITPTMMLVGGVAAMGLIGLTVFVMMRR